MQAPTIITPVRQLEKASDGKHYLLTPNGKRRIIGGQPWEFCFTFQYRRCDERGKIIPRFRQSKKNRLRARARRASLKA